MIRDGYKTTSLHLIQWWCGLIHVAVDIELSSLGMCNAINNWLWDLYYVAGLVFHASFVLSQ